VAVKLGNFEVQTMMNLQRAGKRPSSTLKRASKMQRSKLHHSKRKIQAILYANSNCEHCCVVEIWWNSDFRSENLKNAAEIYRCINPHTRIWNAAQQTTPFKAKDSGHYKCKGQLRALLRRP
jgi:hypothetical protein